MTLEESIMMMLLEASGTIILMLMAYFIVNWEINKHFDQKDKRMTEEAILRYECQKKAYELQVKIFEAWFGDKEEQKENL